MKTKRRKGKAGGRPTDYRAEFAEQGHNYALLGATDAEMADFFGVAESTLNLWKQKHPKFSESIKKGKAAADGKVAASLFKRALGFRVPAVKIFQKDGETFEHEFQEYHPPDTTAQIFWLKNRQAKNWRDKHEHAVGNPDGSNFVNPADIKMAQMVAEMLYQDTMAKAETKVEDPQSQPLNE